MEVKNYSREFAGRTLSVELGKLAGQANGSCRVQYGETTLLVTATMGRRKDTDYFPLSISYEEKYYAAGKIKGSRWIKRESRPSDDAILTGRLIDRTLRPCFNHQTRNEVQVVVTVLSFDRANDPDMLGIFGASLALMISDIPFAGPISGVRVGRLPAQESNDGKLTLNPTYEERVTGEFDIVVAGTTNKINMLEASANIIPEKDISEAVTFGLSRLKELSDFQKEIAKEVGKKKVVIELREHDEELAKFVRKESEIRLDKKDGTGLFTPDKQSFYENLHRAENELKALIEEKYADSKDVSRKVAHAMEHFEEEIDRIVHKNILTAEQRSDGRKLDEVRELTSEVGILPRTHGTGLFDRGATQALSVLTLASPGMEQFVETMEIELTKKRFMHHYVFPPFSVGETGRVGFTNRREIGHGALAERSLEPIIPSKEDFPYTIRLVSEILSSNGSSSMASVCGSTLALMDGGVPIKSPAAGIAMGLMFDEKNEKYKILTDIQGPEDHHGDMDLKVAGTAEGVTGLQMDVKVEGITPKIFLEALEQAKKARLEILDSIKRTISEPRKELSPHAPRVDSVKIDPEKIGALIGPGGKMINAIIEKTGTEIDIEEDGSVFITSPTPDGMELAKKLIADATFEPKPGDTFEGTVVRILDFGAFVEFAGGKEGMVHVSQIAEQRINKPSDVLHIDQKVQVTVREVDEKGRINLTMQPGKSGDTRSSGPRRDSQYRGR